MREPTSELMDGYVDQHISEICTCSFVANSDNHCAHFVCHVTQYNFGLTCYGMTRQGEQSGSANIRVQEVFSHCRRVGAWADKPQDLTKGFIFVTKASNVNVAQKTMANVPRKHIGIFIGTDVWQYKNRLRHVIKQTPEEFHQHYTGAGYAIFFGEFPL
jgi:uncharacterized protein (DUF952 family)